ncbi:MAG: hypothetical protein GY775_14690 [Candidatus Scalindua sp.]|nr:hypothetical protein [Candidatus Scalindua sp.]
MLSRINVNNRSDYQLLLDETKEKIEHLVNQTYQSGTSLEETSEALEQEIRELMNMQGSLLLGMKLQQILDSKEVEQTEQELIEKIPKKMKSEGKKKVYIETSFGYQITVWTRYYTQHRGISRRIWKRKAGVYPGLAVLGIYERCTPYLASLVSIFAAMMGSFAEAQHVLTILHIPLGEKSIRRLVYRSAERARVVQQMDEWQEKASEGEGKRRIIVSTDGGRIRLREKKRGRKTKRNKTRYKGAWREPKILIIYMVDEEGKKIAEYAPIIDGTLKGPQHTFQMIRNYLQQLKIQKDDQILFIADGARWIWKRVPALFKALNLKLEQGWQLIDFFHATQHINAVAKLCKSMKPKQQKSWVTKQCKRLKEGNVDIVIDEIRKYCRGRNSKSIRTELNYFIKNRNRMAYAKVTALHLPIGSGAVESAVRRVVNLRMKGAAIFWCKSNAEHLLMLRSYYKSGRWEQFKKMAFSSLATVANLA